MSIRLLLVQTPMTQLAAFDITFEQVSFRYADQSEWTQQDVSFRFPKRILTASGSGNTITRLISRFADVQQGSYSH